MIETFFTPEEMRAIQVDEQKQIKGMSIEEVSTRIAGMQKATREIALRMVISGKDLHTRLSQKDSPELEAIIERVPAASATLAMRGHNHKPKKETFEQKVTRKADNMARKNPLMQQFLNELKAKGK